MIGKMTVSQVMLLICDMMDDEMLKGREIPESSVTQACEMQRVCTNAEAATILSTFAKMGFISLDGHAITKGPRYGAFYAEVRKLFPRG